MKHLKIFENFETVDLTPPEAEVKPSIFSRTIYRLPTADELYELNSYHLDSQKILSGFKYTLIGRGILSQKNKDMIVDSISILCDLFPDNIEYKKALDESKKLTSRFIR